MNKKLWKTRSSPNNLPPPSSVVPDLSSCLLFWAYHSSREGSTWRHLWPRPAQPWVYPLLRSNLELFATSGQGHYPSLNLRCRWWHGIDVVESALPQHQSYTSPQPKWSIQPSCQSTGSLKREVIERSPWWIPRAPASTGGAEIRKGHGGFGGNLNHLGYPEHPIPSQWLGNANSTPQHFKNLTLVWANSVRPCCSIFERDKH